MASFFSAQADMNLFPNSQAFFVPTGPFAVYDEDNLVWSPDEEFFTSYLHEHKDRIVKSAFHINRKAYTIVCEEGNETYADLLARMFTLAANGYRDPKPYMMEYLYLKCDAFFSHELTSGFGFEPATFSGDTAIEAGLSYMFAVFLISYRLLALDQNEKINISCRSEEYKLQTYISSNHDFDIKKDILDDSFLGTLLTATLTNAGFSLEEGQNDGKKCLCLNAEVCDLPIGTSLSSAGDRFDMAKLFTTFLAFFTTKKGAV